MHTRQEIDPTKTTLEELLVNLEEEVYKNPMQLFAEERSRADELIIQIAEKELLATSTIVKTLLEVFLETGESEYYSRAWFCKRLPWKRSRMSERLQQLVNEGILQTYKRKYALNVTAPFVKRVQRMMRVQYLEIDYEKVIKEFSQEILSGKEKKEEKKTRKPEQHEEKRRKYRKGTKREKERLIQGIRETFFDYLGQMSEHELQEELAMEIEKKILMTIGIVRIS